MIKLRNEIVDNVANGGLDGLKSALQIAIELEHSTIPPYLYALYSIQPGTNQRLSEIIRSVVLEEMLHLSLCCNLLNSIGGTPVLFAPNFIPKYPCPLPGSIASIIVPLAPVSKLLIHDVFMEIEEPEDPLEFQVKTLAESTFQTIGQFYKKIKEQLTLLSSADNIFIGNAARQLGGGLPNMKKVTDLKSAIEAIDIIVEQGEGTTTSPMADIEKPAHYYLFASAYHGRELITSSGTFTYAGDEIPFDSSGIIPMATNPEQSKYEGTDAKTLNDRFNKTYSTLLMSLHNTFNGNPMEMLQSIGLMRQLKQEVADLSKIEVENGIFAGPTFTFTTEIV